MTRLFEDLVYNTRHDGNQNCYLMPTSWFRQSALKYVLTEDVLCQLQFGYANLKLNR